jgi:RNA-directed DNA polymerase
LWRGKAGGGELPTRFELVSIAAVMQTRSRKVEMPSGLSVPLAFAIYTVVEVGALLDHGHPEVVDADLADYFGSIPHAELLKSVARRIVDRRVLHLIKMWLDCPVEETDDRGRKTRTTEARDNRRGTPQGLPISRLVSL